MHYCITRIQQIITEVHQVGGWEGGVGRRRVVGGRKTKKQQKFATTGRVGGWSEGF